MGLLDGGRDFLAQATINDSSPVFYSAANAAIAVGNGTAGFVKSQVDLQGASKARVGMDSTWPKRTTNALEFKSTFADGIAQFAWEEWGIVNNATSGGTFLNRAVTSMGTKAAGSVWVLTATVTITN